MRPAWLRKLDYRLSPELEIEYEDKINEMTNKTFIMGFLPASIGIWIYYYSYILSNQEGDAFNFILALQVLFVVGIFSVLIKGRMRRLLNYFTPVAPLAYTYALMSLYMPTLLDQSKMAQAQNWILCVVFLLYAIERVSPLFSILNGGLTTGMFYYLQSQVPQLATTEAFQFNWQMAAVHASGLLVCVSHCRDSRRSFKLGKDLKFERQQSEALLRNVLPEAIVEELKNTITTLAHLYKDVTVIFIDLVGFTKKSSIMEPSRLVTLLDDLFTRFDELASKHGVEKIKTIGDAYMAATGCPNPDGRHAERMIDFAIDLNQVIKEFNQSFSADFRIKVGMASGQVMGGVIGKKRVSFDLWGDVVNLASRIESIAHDGEIAVSEATAFLIKDYVQLSEARSVDLKGKGPTIVFTVLGKRALSSTETSKRILGPRVLDENRDAEQRPAA